GSGCGKPEIPASAPGSFRADDKTQKKVANPGLGASRAEDKAKNAEYFPLSIGTTWHYSVKELQGNQARDAKRVLRVAKHEKIGTDMCDVIEHSTNGKPSITEYIAFKEDGLYRYMLGSKQFDPPLCLLRLPVKKGESWKGSLKLTDEALPVTCTLSE